MQKDYADEATLVEAINQNDPRAWEHLRQHCSGSVRHYVMRNMGSYEDAEDMLGEGLADLIEKVKKEKLVMSAKVSTLLITFCKNKWNNVLKSRDIQQRNIGKLHDAPSYTPEEEMDRAVFREVALQCFSQLEKLCQKILKMVEKGKSHKEIGKIMRLKTVSVKNRNHLCHKEWVRLVNSHPGYLNPGDHNAGNPGTSEQF